MKPLNFRKWIDEHRHLLKPPVGNAQIWEGDRDFMVTVVGGPNARTDYHINEGEEFFYQVEGDIVLRLLEGGKPVEVPLREGDIFLLPPHTPHSPQRPAGSVGLVIERQRSEAERDGFQWYCAACHHLLYEEFFALTNIETQFPAIFERFYADSTRRTCRHCGTVLERPAPAIAR